MSSELAVKIVLRPAGTPDEQPTVLSTHVEPLHNPTEVTNPGIAPPQSQVDALYGLLEEYEGRIHELEARVQELSEELQRERGLTAAHDILEKTMSRFHTGRTGEEFVALTKDTTDPDLQAPVYPEASSPFAVPSPDQVQTDVSLYQADPDLLDPTPASSPREITGLMTKADRAEAMDPTEPALPVPEAAKKTQTKVLSTIYSMAPEQTPTLRARVMDIHKQNTERMERPMDLASITPAAPVDAVPEVALPTEKIRRPSRLELAQPAPASYGMSSNPSGSELDALRSPLHSLTDKIRNLLGGTPSYDFSELSTGSFERPMFSDPDLRLPEPWYKRLFRGGFISGARSF